jgi:predicted porin
MTRTLAALAAALIATGARAQTPPAAPPPPDAPPAAAPAAAAPAAAPAPAPAAPAQAAAPVAAPAPKKEQKPRGTFAVGPKSQILIQGRAWVEVNNVRADKGVGTTPVHNISRVSSNSSYLRVRGERELDYGFTAIAQVEAEVGFDGSGGSPFSSTRNTFVGLSSPYGELSLGKFDSPSKETTIGRDPFGGTGIFGYYNVFTKYRADRRMNNAIMYETPTIKGASAMVAFSLGEAVVNSATAPTIRTNPYMINGAVHYRSGPLFLGVAYEYRNDCGNPDTEAAPGPSCNAASLSPDASRPKGYDQVYRVGADYTIKSTYTKLAAVYDRIELELAQQGALVEQKLNRDAYWASWTQGLGTNRHQIIVNYGLASKYSGTNIGNTSKTGAQTYTAAYRFNFDSDLMLYAAVVQIMNEDNQNTKIGSGGVPTLGGTKADGTFASWSAPKGSTITGFGAGIRYMF